MILCAAEAAPSGAGALHPRGLAFAPRTGVPGAAERLGAVALCAPGSRMRTIRFPVGPAARAAAAHAFG
jgi:hypothetical protein